MTPEIRENPVVTDEYIKAVNLNRRIITAAQLAQQSLYEMCTGFKEMRDSKLYKELGYTYFGDYCEDEVGVTLRQVEKYIVVAEKLPPDYANPGSRFAQLGIKKLYLLTTLSEEERAEIVENTDLESASVRDLEKQIKQLKADKDKAVAEKSAAEAESAARKDAVSALEKTKRELEDRITDLEKDIKDLENRPVETAVERVEVIPEGYIAASALEDESKKHNEQIEQLENENIERLRKVNAEKTELEKKLCEVQKQLDEAKNKLAVPDKDGVFKAYFKNAYNSLNTLVEYVQQHTEYSPKVNALVDNIKNSLEV